MEKQVVTITKVEDFPANAHPLHQKWHRYEVTIAGKQFGELKSFGGCDYKATRNNGEDAKFKWLNDSVVFLTGLAYNSFELKID